MTPPPTVAVTDDDGRQIRLAVYQSGATLADVPLNPTYALVLAARIIEAATRFLQNIERRETNG
jgi:hypothetical protein